MGDLIYLYGLIPTKDAASFQSSPSITGFDGEQKLYTIPINHVTAVVGKLDSDHYSEEALKDKIDNDLDWLKEKALHHHETVVALHKKFTIIPLKFCTIYKNEDSLQKKILSNESKIEETLSNLHGNEEWNVKIFSDDNKLKTQISEHNAVIETKKQLIRELSRGRQFFEKKKIDKLIEEEFEIEKSRMIEHVHGKLKEHALHSAIKKSWSKDLTGLKENMAYNSVFLLQNQSVESFLEEMQQFELEFGGTGWRFDVTGPWPAYHFSSF